MGSERGAKSRKRCAAEAALELRYGGSSAAAEGGQRGRGRLGVRLSAARVGGTDAQPAVAVAACGCGAERGCPWAGCPLAVPHLNLHEVESEGRRAQGGAGGAPGDSKRTFFPGLQAHALLAETEAEADAALAELRSSMADGVVAIDLEWRPDLTPSCRSPVALIQLASSSLCVLLRTCRMGNQLPPSLRAFLQDSSITFVGFAWDSADGKKMAQTFKWSRADFGCLLDLQVIATRLGYHGCGLAALTKQVMGFEMAKDPLVSMSNWQAKQLSPQQVYYAALDALMTGHLFRGLGLWHSSPSACSACGTALGQFLPCELRCHMPSCRRSFLQLDALMHHSQAKRHPVAVQRCGECRRWQERPGARAQRGGGDAVSPTAAASETGPGTPQPRQAVQQAALCAQVAPPPARESGPLAC